MGSHDLKLNVLESYRTLADVTAKIQSALSLSKLSQIVVEGAIRLGFERVRFWQYDESGKELIGLSQAGNEGLEAFSGFCMPLCESPYAARARLARQPLYFQGMELGEGYLERHLASQGYHSPVGEWVLLPLWHSRRCLGMLALDNAAQRQALRADQRELIELFGNQVAAALDRVLILELDNVRRQKHLDDVLRATKAVTNPQDLAPTLQAISEAVFDAAPGLSALIIWYKDPEDGQLKLGASTGVRNDAILRDLLPDERNSPCDEY